MSASTYRRLLAVAFTVWVLLSSPAQAQNEDGSFELGAAFSYILFDDNTVLDKDFTGSVSLGYNFTKRHMGEIQFTAGTASTDRGAALEVDYDILRIGYVYNAFPTEKRVSFFRAGAGIQSIQPEEFTGSGSISDRLKEDSDDLVIYAGGGIRWFLNQRFAIRLAGSLDFVDAGEDGITGPDIQATADLGVSFLLGGGAQPAPAEPETDDTGDTGETESGQ